MWWFAKQSVHNVEQKCCLHGGQERWWEWSVRQSRRLESVWGESRRRWWWMFSSCSASVARKKERMEVEAVMWMSMMVIFMLAVFVQRLQQWWWQLWVLITTTIVTSGSLLWVGDGRSSSNSGCFPALQRVTEMVEHTWEQWVEYSSYLGVVSTHTSAMS